MAPARGAGAGTPRSRRPSPCGVRRSIREGSASGAVDGCRDDLDGSLRRVRDCGCCEEEGVPEHEEILADASAPVEWFSADPEHPTANGALPQGPMFLRASRTESGARRPRSAATKSRTARGSVFAYSRRHHPIAFRMKKSASPERRTQ